MGQTNAIVLCGAYILGLLLAALPWGGFGALALGGVLALVVPRWRSAPRFPIWLVAGLVGLLATLYFQLRIPQPGPNDISRQISPNQPTIATVQGVVSSPPRQTRSQKAQFWLEVQQSNNEPRGGTLYATVPLLQATGLHPGQIVKVSGTLYLPKSATNPGGFDFQSFLAREASFAGLSGTQVEMLQSPKNWDWSQVQARVARSQILWLDSPVGPVVSAMVLGSKGIDLPHDVKDQFLRAGLAHALAASGFQTSLILGVVLALTRHL
ncbi:MAG TPA: ComEC family competence protein, partial [Thermosynechococcaceae cyanobacterium]